MNKKLQVFVSSTYTDLIEERQAVFKCILDAGHIPVGMELINAGIPQMQTIRKWIDESDVFIIILGGRYGSIENESGLSYTELEYQYANYQDKHIFAIVLDDDFLHSKAHSYGLNTIYDNNKNLYNKFKSKVFYNNGKFVNSISDITISITKLLFVISIKQELRKNDIFDDLLLYKLISKIVAPTDDISIIISIYKYFCNIIDNFGIKSICDITANKCIVDPLGNPIDDITNIRIDVSEVNDWMLNELKKNPTDLYQLSSRRFEELVAEILIRKGYSVELTPATRDGGKDIYAARKDDLGSFLYVVECKNYNPNHKVGVNVLRDLYGVLSKERATYGVAVTTSYFSKPAQEFQQDIQFQMSLQDFDSIKKWLCDVTKF